MTTETKFKLALKEMMLTTPLEDINVTALCKKCDCHRQTFYYHYQDLYDLIAAIFLNEDLDELERAKTVESSLESFLMYVKDNFKFLKATYNSAAHDLPDDFIFSKLTTKIFKLLSADKKNLGIKLGGCRTAARRFARIISDEYSFIFKDGDMSTNKLVKEMTKFSSLAVDILLPSIINMSKEAEK
ncbi:MAG: hypothetical protein MJ239_01150 [Bacilli bacterium]|nr:hypothetical protein [Bacilli bacterium]